MNKAICLIINVLIIIYYVKSVSICLDQNVDVDFFSIIMTLICAECLNIIDEKVFYIYVGFLRYAIIILIVMIYYKQNYLKVYYTTSFIFILLFCFRVIFLSILRMFFDISYLNYWCYKNLFSIVPYVVLFLIIKSFCAPKLFANIDKLFENRFRFEIVTVMMLFTLSGISIIFSVPKLNNYIIIGIILIVICLITIIIFFVKNAFLKKQLKLRNQFLEDNIAVYEKLLLNYRTFKHNIKNDLITIKSMCDKSTQEIINLKIKQYNCDYELISNINMIPEGLKSIIHTKVQLNKSSKFNLIINLTKKDLSSIPGTIYVQLADVLSICIDNAVEASKLAKKKTIIISMEKDSNKLLIKIINYFNSNLDIDQLGSLNYTTKASNGGLGLYYIKQACKSKINVHRVIVDDMFISKITVKCRK